MKTLTAVVLTLCLISASFAQDIGWPREKSNADATIIYYQPQLDEWKDYRQLDARMAVSVRQKTGQPTVNGANGQRAQTAQTSATSAGAQRDRAAASTNSLQQGGAQRSSTASSNQLQSLDRDAKARQQGNERTQKYQRQSRSGEGRSRTRSRRN
jgi:hypothetical protein